MVRNRYQALLTDHQGTTVIGDFTTLSNARRAARREMARRGGRAYIEGFGERGYLFLQEAVDFTPRWCPACKDGGPPHNASPRCESGRRNHCSCDVCF